MRPNKELDSEILKFLHNFVDYRINSEMEEPYRGMILHAFKKFRTPAEIKTLISKYSKYKIS